MLDIFLNDKKQWWTYKGICSWKDVDIFEIPNGCQGNQVFLIMVEETWIDVSHWWFSCLTHFENCRFTNWKKIVTFPLLVFLTIWKDIYYKQRI